MLNEKEKEVIYFFPAYYLMIPLLMGAVLISAFAYTVIHPICEFLRENCILVSLLFAVFLAMLCIFLYKLRRNIKFGLGAGLAIGQFILLLVLIMFKIASVSNPNKVDAFSIGTTVIVSLLSFAYGSFNCKMVVDAFSESFRNPNNLLIVGIVGAIIDILIVLFV